MTSTYALVEFSPRSACMAFVHQELHDNLDVMTAAVSQKGEAGNGTKVFDGFRWSGLSPSGGLSL